MWAALLATLAMNFFFVVTAHADTCYEISGCKDKPGFTVAEPPPPPPRPAPKPRAKPAAKKAASPSPSKPAAKPAAKEKPQRGEVVAAGKGRILEDGKVLPLEVKVGDKVLFSKYMGTEIKIDNQEYLVLKEEDVLGVFH